MVTVSARQAKELQRLKRAARRLGITQDRIAAEAGVTRPLVVNVFARRSTSSNVVETTRRLIAEAKAAQAAAPEERRAS